MANILTSPRAFFHENKESLFVAWGYYVVVIAILYFVMLLSSVFALAGVELGLKEFVSYIMQSATAPFLTAAFISLGMYFIRGKGSYDDNVRVSCYASAVGSCYTMLAVPLLVLMLKLFGATSEVKVLVGLLLLLPLLLLMVGAVVHPVIIQLVGISEYHKVTLWEAFLGSMLIPLCFYIAVALAIAATLSIGGFI